MTLQLLWSVKNIFSSFAVLKFQGYWLYHITVTFYQASAIHNTVCISYSTKCKAMTFLPPKKGLNVAHWYWRWSWIHLWFFILWIIKLIYFFVFSNFLPQNRSLHCLVSLEMKMLPNVLCEIIFLFNHNHHTLHTIVVQLIKNVQFVLTSVDWMRLWSKSILPNYCDLLLHSLFSEANLLFLKVHKLSRIDITLPTKSFP